MNYTHGSMNPKLEVRHLKLLVTVAEEGSVTEAGRRLHLTQSALSHPVRDAEQKLGTALFLRLGRRMVLTPAGERLIACARRVLAELGDAEAQIEGLHGGARGEIRLSTECYTCYHWLPPVLPELQRDYPHVSVRIVIEATRQPVAALLRGELERAVVSSPVRDRNLVVERLFDDEWAVILP